MSSTIDIAQFLKTLSTYPEGAEITTFKGGCHCHKFTFELDHPSFDVKKPYSCNCTLCTRTGTVLVCAPEASFRLKGDPTSWDELSFVPNKSKTNKHYFCPNCGNWIVWKAKGFVGVNIRMIDDIKLENISITPLDGRSM